MQDPGAMDGLDRAGELHPDPKCLPQGERSGTTDAVAQATLPVIRHDEVGTSCHGDAGLQDVDNVGVAEQPAHRTLLTQEPIETVPGQIRRQLPWPSQKVIGNCVIYRLSALIWNMSRPVVFA